MGPCLGDRSWDRRWLPPPAPPPPVTDARTPPNQHSGRPLRSPYTRRTNAMQRVRDSLRFSWLWFRN
jgi:hypothetical protein